MSEKRDGERGGKVERERKRERNKEKRTITW